MDTPLFQEVADGVRGMVKASLGDVQTRSHRGGVKIWFGDEQSAKEHYEAQFIPGHLLDVSDYVVEIGFHAEHSKEAENQAVIDHLLSHEKKWRKLLGAEAEAGPFLGRATWRRLSETWVGPRPDDPDLSLELASRLAEYVDTIEPLRRARRGD